MNSKIVLGVVIGLIAGLVLGVFIGLSISPSTKTVAETNNQVKVSGTIQEQNPSEIYFFSISQTVQTSAIITNGQYSVVLLGNQSYGVTVTYNIDNDLTNSYTLYVPSGVTTFTANF
jgi:hypothetical protein